MREASEALGLDERAERHLLGHYALDHVTDLMTGEELLPPDGIVGSPWHTAERPSASWPAASGQDWRRWVGSFTQGRGGA